MRIFLILIITLVIASLVFTEDFKINYDKINIKKIDEIEIEELEKISEKIDFYSIGMDKAILIVENTNGFDFDTYIIKNEIKKMGRLFIGLGSFNKNFNITLNNITDTELKEKILKIKERNQVSKNKYDKINQIRSIRIKALDYISRNRALIKDIDAFYSNLSASEVEVFKDCENKYKRPTKSYWSAYSKYYRNKEEAFSIKHDLVFQNEIKDKKYTCRELLDLMFASEHYLGNFNLELLNKAIAENGVDNNWDDLLLALRLWKSLKSFEGYLFDDFYLQIRLVDFSVIVLKIILNKNFAEKKAELVEVLGEKLYLTIFDEKLELSKIAELNFENEKEILRGIK